MTIPSTLDFENLPPTINVNIDYGNNFISPEGKAIKGVIDIALSDFVFDSTIEALFDFNINNLTSDDSLVADGNISGELELRESQLAGFDGFLNLKLVDFTTTGFKHNGEIDNVFIGLELALDDSSSTQGTVITTIRNLTFGDDFVSGVITTTLTSTQTSFSGNLNTMNGQTILELVIDKLPDGSSQINTTGPSSINGESFTITDLVVTSDSCTGDVLFENGEQFRFNGDCDSALVSATDDNPSASLAGFWDSEFGCVSAQQSGNTVSADIFYFNGNQGVMLGVIDNNQYTYEWSNSVDSGTGVLTADVNAWRGFFIDSKTGQKGDWNLQKQTMPCQ
jgi:hypothetical protein